MSDALLNVVRDGGIVTVTIQRPERRNALHGPLWTELKSAAESLSEKAPRAVIFQGAEGHFSAGMDLKMDNPLVQRLAGLMAEKDQAGIRALIEELKSVVDAIASIPAPTIAAIEGACVGGGLEVALACDLRVASKEAFFSLPETRVGMVPDVGGTMRTMRLVGRARATELIVAGRQINGEEAAAWGLVNRVVEPKEALAAAQAMAEEIRLSAPGCTRTILNLLRADQPTFEAETLAGVEALSGGEAMEGAMAFMEKRPPKWVSQD